MYVYIINITPPSSPYHTITIFVLFLLPTPYSISTPWLFPHFYSMLLSTIYPISAPSPSMLHHFYSSPISAPFPLPRPLYSMLLSTPCHISTPHSISVPSSHPRPHLMYKSSDQRNVVRRLFAYISD